MKNKLLKGILAKKKNKKGFTLVELVIVVAVLIIIAGIAIPTVHNVIDNANKATDASNAQSIELAIKTYGAEKAADTDAPTISDDKLTSLLTAYGVNLDVGEPKQSGCEYYYNNTTGKVVVAKSNPDSASDSAYIELKSSSTFSYADSKVTISNSTT